MNALQGTMLGQIEKWARERPDATALHRMNSGGDWESVTWRQYWDRVQAVGRGLMALGVQRGDSIALLAGNSPEWVICQHGITAAGATTCAIYTTNTASQVAYIVRHSESRLVMLDTREQLAKIESSQTAGEVEVDHIIGMGDLKADLPKMQTLAILEELGRAETPQEKLRERLDATTLDDSPLRVYTSGTTGAPKGAELTHRSIRAVREGIMAAYGDVFARQPQRGVSYLPLCHVAEQIFTNYVALEVAANTYFCPDLSQLKDYLVKVRPTYLLGVPRVWEKLQAALTAQLSKATGIKKTLAEWSLGTEAASIQHEMKTGKPANGLRRRLARKLVVDKIRNAIGVSDVALAFSGAAPLTVSTAEFFQGLGILIHEGFGMTETSGVATIPVYGKPRLGTVGQAMHGVQIRITDEGELQLKGENMVRSYHKLPDKTAELWDGDWMRTGDLAAIDPDGNVRITGRMKDLIITAGGKNVGPVEMEQHLTNIPGIGQAVVVGDKKPYLCALLVIDPENVQGLLDAAEISDKLSAAEAAADPRVKDFLQKRVESDCNAHVARYQQIKHFDVLAQPFTVDSGELTPTMKLKRHVVNEKYATVIEDLYGDRSKAAAAKPAASPTSA